MRAYFNKEDLLVLLRDFYELTGLRTVVFDEWDIRIAHIFATISLLPVTINVTSIVPLKKTSFPI